jgi:hypothetical protein
MSTLLVVGEKLDQHDIICRLKDLAIELGKTPSGKELARSGISERQVTSAFGSHSLACQAAGLEPNCRKKKIDNSIFELNIDTHLDRMSAKTKATQDKKNVEFVPYPKCLFIPDFHAPWGDMRIIEKACEFAQKEKPEFICQLGDLYDFISHSRFPTSKNIYLPKDEKRVARKQAEDMWRCLHSAAPEAKKYQSWGNHDRRPLKRILETYPEAEIWVEQMINELMSFPNVETLSDEREELILPGNVMVIHGYLSRPGSHRDYNLGFNVVHGHLHTAHVMYKKIQDKILWEMNCGIAADVSSKAFSYTPQRTLNWAKGFGWLDQYGPRFVPE